MSEPSYPYDDRPPREHRGRPYRPLFWPIVLIGVGAIWLLTNLGWLTPQDLGSLWSLWPLILIVIGLDLLLGRIHPLISALIGLGTVALVLLFLLYGSHVGLPTTSWPWGGPFTLGSAEIKSKQLSAPLEGARSARIILGLGEEPATIDVLEDSTNLIEADLRYTGDVNWSASGQDERIVRLEKTGGPWGLFTNWSADTHWNVWLSPELPIDLQIDAGSGPAHINAEQLQISAFSLDAGSGHVDARLPGGKYDARIDTGSGGLELAFADEAAVDVNISAGSGSTSLALGRASRTTLDLDAGSGSFALDIGESSDVNAEIDGGSGSITITTPPEAAVRVEVIDAGSGSVSVPAGLELVEDRGDRDADTGVWETPDFDRAAHTIVLRVSMGSGSIRVR